MNNLDNIIKDFYEINEKDLEMFYDNYDNFSNRINDQLDDNFDKHQLRNTVIFMTPYIVTRNENNHLKYLEAKINNILLSKKDKKEIERDIKKLEKTIYQKRKLIRHYMMTSLKH